MTSYYMDLMKYENSCSVLTPYYTEDVLFSLKDLEVTNEDGVSILFYLQKIFPGLFFTTVFIPLCILQFWGVLIALMI